MLHTINISLPELTVIFLGDRWELFILDLPTSYGSTKIAPHLVFNIQLQVMIQTFPCRTEDSLFTSYA